MPKNDTQANEPDNITIRTRKKFKQVIAVEGARRGHNITAAGEKILKLGLPLYLKQFPVVCNGAESTSRTSKP